MNITHIIDIKEPGRLFTFDDYYGKKIEPYRLFVTHTSPAYVIEYSINEHFNVHFVRWYSVSHNLLERFVGKDVISVNQKYVAHLMFDLEKLVEVVRIYYRGETNFAYGHTDIELKEFVTDVSSIHFLGYNDFESLYVKNAFVGYLYSVNDVELVIDTKTFASEYHKYINETFEMNMTAYNIEDQSKSVSTYFNVTFAARYDMTTYFIGKSSQYLFGHSYGDPTFSQIVSEFYGGPDLKFDLTLKSSDPYDLDLVIPNITKTQESSVIRELSSEDDCTESFFNRFIDPDGLEENIAFY